MTSHHRRKVAWSSLALSLSTLSPMTPEPEAWLVFNDNFTYVRGDKVNCIYAQPPHHHHHQYHHCHPNQNIPQVGWWLEQSVPGQVLLPVVQEQCHRVSTINMIFQTYITFSTLTSTSTTSWTFTTPMSIFKWLYQRLIHDQFNHRHLHNFW